MLQTVKSSLLTCQGSQWKQSCQLNSVIVLTIRDSRESIRSREGHRQTVTFVLWIALSRLCILGNAPSRQVWLMSAAAMKQGGWVKETHACDHRVPLNSNYQPLIMESDSKGGELVASSKLRKVCGFQLLSTFKAREKEYYFWAPTLCVIQSLSFFLSLLCAWVCARTCVFACICVYRATYIYSWILCCMAKHWPCNWFFLPFPSSAPGGWGMLWSRGEWTSGACR